MGVAKPQEELVDEFCHEPEEYRRNHHEKGPGIKRSLCKDGSHPIALSEDSEMGR